MTRGSPGSILHRPISVEEIVLLALTALIGTRFSVGVDAPAGALIGIALAPIWMSLLTRFRAVGVLLATLVVCVGSGVILTLLQASTHDSTLAGLVSRSSMLVGLIGSVGVLLYAGVRLGPAPMAIAYGVGMLVGTQLDDASTINAWRFTYSIPVAIFVLAVLSLKRSVVLQIAALTALALVGLANDSRSNSAMLLLAAVVIAWQRFARLVSPGRRWGGHVVGVLLFGLATFQLVQTSILEGYFGEATRQRTEAQLTTSGGSLILGGRPEAAASAALIEAYPLGLGSGTTATLSDINVASTAMAAIGYDPDNNYVKVFMFGGPIEVHSLLGDFWLWFGIPGVVACALMAAIVVVALERQLRYSVLSGLMAYLTIRFTWDLLFSPAFSTMKLLALTIPLAAIAVAATAVGRRSGHRDLSLNSPTMNGGGSYRYLSADDEARR